MTALYDQTKRLLELLWHDEMPYGVCYAGTPPEGFGPRPGEVFSREREAAGAINWQKASDSFSCIIGHLLVARQKRKAAWLCPESCGCSGGGFFTGMYAPYMEKMVGFVSTGVPGTPIEGEHYLSSHESMRGFLNDAAPPPAPKPYCVLKPLEDFTEEEPPLVVLFFARPEVLTGLHVLTGYATGSHQAVISPFGSGCAGLVAWPLACLSRGRECAVLGGFDPSARKYMRVDELSFAIPLPLYRKMLHVMEDSALPRATWQSVRTKVRKSAEVWSRTAGAAPRKAAQARS